MQQETQQPEETTEVPVEQPSQELTAEQQEGQLRMMANAEMKNLLYQANNVIMGIMNYVVTGNGVKQVDKGLASAALINAVLFALDFGVESSRVKLFQKGHKFYKENHTLAALLVKAMETKMVLLAYKAKDKEAEEQQAPKTEALNELDNILNEEGEQNG